MCGKDNNTHEIKSPIQLPNDFHSAIRGTILSACLKADGGCKDKMQ